MLVAMVPGMGRGQVGGVWMGALTNVAWCRRIESGDGS